MADERNMGNVFGTIWRLITSNGNGQIETISDIIEENLAEANVQISDELFNQLVAAAVPGDGQAYFDLLQTIPGLGTARTKLGNVLASLGLDISDATEGWIQRANVFLDQQPFGS